MRFNLQVRGERNTLTRRVLFLGDQHDAGCSNSSLPGRCGDAENAASGLPPASRAAGDARI